jgi:hypothetical protein
MPYMPIHITDASFAPGKVLRMDLTEEDGLILKNGAKDRAKFFIVIGQDIDQGIVGSLLINSNINPNAIRTKELLDCQFPLKSKDYNFLDHDSYLNCSKIFPLDKVKIRQEAKEIGSLNAGDLSLVIDHIKNSEVISMKEKKRYSIVIL